MQNMHLPGVLADMLMKNAGLLEHHPALRAASIHLYPSNLVEVL
jgi:hypothetical protein